MTINSFPLSLALRYSIPGRGSGMSGFLSLVSLLGLSLGVFSLIVVISVMNGFERELQSRLLSLLPHVQLHSPQSAQLPSAKQNTIAWRELLKTVATQPQVAGAAPYIETTVMLSANQRFRAATMTGVDLDYEQRVSQLHQHIIAGDIAQLANTRYGLVIGRILARQLGVEPGDSITMVMPKINITPLGPVTREKRFTVVAVFEVGAELDQNLVLSNLAASQKLLGRAGRIDGVRIKTENQLQSQIISDALIDTLVSANPTYQQLQLTDWRERNSSLFRAVMMEKIMIFLLLLSVVAVASFNIVSIILMTVTDKRSDIAVLRTMGASAVDIRRLFIIQGLLIGVIGTASGAILAVLTAPNIGGMLSWFEQLSGWQLFDPTVYFIPYLPSELRANDVIVVVSIALLISLLATLYPASKAANIEPAEALAYEH